MLILFRSIKIKLIFDAIKPFIYNCLRNIIKSVYGVSIGFKIGKRYTFFITDQKM